MKTQPFYHTFPGCSRSGQRLRAACCAAMIPLLLGIALGSAGVLSAAASHAQPVAGKRFVIVLIDESPSFATQTTRIGAQTLPLSKGARYWTAQIVKSLGEGEGFCLIGIRDRVTASKDMRVAPVTIEPGYRGRIRRDQLAAQVMNLEARPSGKGTDLPGALRVAAFVFSQRPEFQPVLLVFSDLYADYHEPKQERIPGLRFPSRTRGYCFYVRQQQVPEWERIRRRWQAILSAAGVSIRSEDFVTDYDTDQTVIRRALGQ